MARFAAALAQARFPKVRPAQASDAQQVFASVTSAFVADPPARWMYPDDRQYERFFPTFVEAFGGAAIARGTAAVAKGGSGAALWFPPGTTPDEDALAALLEKSIADTEKQNAFAVFDEMARQHPEEPHWYLPLIGVVPGQQGHGYGSALLDHGLAQCDREGLPAYLEATSPRSVPLYERHGFRLVGEIRIGRCPPIFPMLRAAVKPWRG